MGVFLTGRPKQPFPHSHLDRIWTCRFNLSRVHYNYLWIVPATFQILADQSRSGQQVFCLALLLLEQLLTVLPFRRLPRCCRPSGCVGHIRLECGDRYLPHHGTHSHALGNEPKTREEACRHCRAWCGCICPCLLASKDCVCFYGKSQWC
jgi:hypothetical protein